MADTIDTQLSRIEGAKSTIKNSIANKGVTVPATALIDEYYTYIDQIMVPKGNIQLTTATATDVSTYATATVDGGNLNIWFKGADYVEGDEANITIEKDSVYTLTTDEFSEMWSHGKSRFANNVAAYLLDFGKIDTTVWTTTTSGTGTTQVTITPGSTDQYVNITKGWQQEDAHVKIAAVSWITYYTGSTDPDSSLGNDGDIYLEE